MISKNFRKFSKIPIFRKPFSKFRNNNFEKYQEKIFEIFEIFRKSTNTINIYTPNSSTSQCEYIQTLYTYLSSKKNIILGGDFSYREYEKKITRIGNNSIKILI